jgi:UDP-N-acetylglucosamine 2-epimerase
LVLCIASNSAEALRLVPLVRTLSRHLGLGGQLCAFGEGVEACAALAPLFGISVDVELQGAGASAEPRRIFEQAFAGMGSLLRQSRPSGLVVSGESAAALGAAQAAAFAGVPVAHVEAGSREDEDGAGPNSLPGLIDRLAHWHFASTLRAREVLLSEGIEPERITLTGSTAIDAFLSLRERVDYRPAQDFEDRLGSELVPLVAYWEGPVIVAISGEGAGRAAARRGVRLGRTAECVRLAARAHPQWLFVCLPASGSSLVPESAPPAAEPSNVFRRGELEFEALAWLLNRCDLVLTDSHQVHEQASALGKPVIDASERSGGSRLLSSGGDPQRTLSVLERALGDRTVYQHLLPQRAVLEDGLAAERMAAVLARTWSEGSVHGVQQRRAVPA